MQKILVLGAGLSSGALISYLLEHAGKGRWKVRIADISEEMARQKIMGHPAGETVKLDAGDEDHLAYEIHNADLVISMLPARMHPRVARHCVRYGRHMITASYVSPELRELDEEARKNNVLLLNEIGVDPGIDHMSAMYLLERLRKQGAEITAFESNTGGLVAPKHDNNPWNYKFTWNPRNVVLAGQGGAQFLHNGMYKYIPYHKIFRRYERIYILDLGEFEAYPNRDSLKYQDAYGLQNVETMFRGTIRRPGFCKAWDILVQTGMTDDSYIMHHSDQLTYREYTNSFLAWSPTMNVEDKLAEYTGVDKDSETMYKIRWLGLFSNERAGLRDATPAQILQSLLEKRWKLDPDDKDMIVMQHQIEYKTGGRKKKILSSLVYTGKDAKSTAMSVTVGLPVAIAARLIMEGKISLRGVHIPIHPEIYMPVLQELSEHGIRFVEEEGIPQELQY
ncbi:MAG: saccharopine dehydrogenase [Bacteroidales bacterium]|jgi:saccharopine dehydrogenase-like NADP-dependent oxidoreductase|nr:saccharopine dehydrogenase [Bacteroidales bacterium]